MMLFLQLCILHVFKMNCFFHQVDASVPYEEQAQRWALRDKYIGKPSAKAINQYTDKYVSPVPTDKTIFCI